MLGNIRNGKESSRQLSPLRGKKTLYLILIITEEKIDSEEMTAMLGRGYSAREECHNNGNDSYQITVRHGNEKLCLCLIKDSSKVYLKKHAVIRECDKMGIIWNGLEGKNLN